MTNEEARSNLEKLSQLYDDGMIDFSIIRESIKVAIEALEKQIPKKIGSKVMDYMGRVKSECGNCGEIVEDPMWSYCPWCGQRIGEE